MKPAIALGAFYALAMASPAYAYLDPITGSFLLQAIVGGFAAVLMAVRRVREKVLGLIGLRKADAEPSQASKDSGNV